MCAAFKKMVVEHAFFLFKMVIEMSTGVQITTALWPISI